MRIRRRGFENRIEIEAKEIFDFHSSQMMENLKGSSVKRARRRVLGEVERM
jgi:hypothetical protein